MDARGVSRVDRRVLVRNPNCRIRTKPVEDFSPGPANALFVKLTPFVEPALDNFFLSMINDPFGIDLRPARTPKGPLR